MGLRSSDDGGYYDHCMMPKWQHEEAVNKLRAELQSLARELAHLQAVLADTQNKAEHIRLRDAAINYAAELERKIAHRDSEIERLKATCDAHAEINKETLAQRDAAEKRLERRRRR